MTGQAIELGEAFEVDLLQEAAVGDVDGGAVGSDDLLERTVVKHGQHHF